jgi:ectoine hydroxylase-related dioxygenase (phytanoyl-CoA dioxygenase family)
MNQMSATPTALGLPPIRTDIDAAKGDLDRFGLARVAGAITADERRQARERLLEQAAGEDAAGVGFHDSGDAEAGFRNGPNQRVWNLINKGEIFRHLVVNPTVRTLISHMLGEDVLLSSLTGNIANPGGVAQGLHRDDGYAPHDIGFPIVANSLYMLDDFTEENGGTRVAPGSHLESGFTAASPPDTTAAVGPAGTVMIFDGRLWHGTGANRSNSGRTALLGYYCRPFVRQQENMTMSLAPEVIAQCSPELLRLLGFETWRTLGMVEGSFHGVLNPRPTNFVTELRP